MNNRFRPAPDGRSDGFRTVDRYYTKPILTADERMRAHTEAEYQQLNDMNAAARAAWRR